MSCASGQATDAQTGPSIDCQPCADHATDDDEFVLDVTEDEPELESLDGTEDGLSNAQIGAMALGADTEDIAELEQANGKRVVKVLASVGIGVVILNEIFAIGALQNDSGMFSGVIDSIGTTGVAALTLLVVGLVAYAGAVAMGYLDMF